MPEEITAKPEKPKSSPKDVFMHLLMIGMLYVGAFSFVSLWFDYINFLFPDALNYYYQGILDGILFATATLVVVFPVYLLLSRLLEKEMAADPEKRELRARKWLVYLTLFIAAIAIIVDVVRLIYDFLSGALTTPFFLKIFVVLLVAAAVFGYYLWDVRRKSGAETKIPKTLALVVSLVVFGSIVGGFFIVGTPSHQREARLDNQRISDLQNMQSQIINYWQQKNTLPAKLSNLADSISGFVPPKDPETGMEYEYSVKDPLSFELCAAFKTASIGTDMTGGYSKPLPIGYSGDPYNQNWSHQAEHTCFLRAIDPELYKISKPVPIMVR
jgi:hypothetical protein